MSWDDMHGRNYGRAHREQGGFTLFKILAIPIIALVVGLGIYAIFTDRVDATESCVVTEFGKKMVNSDGSPVIVGPGLHFMGPSKSLQCFTISRKTMELVAGDPAQSNSKADYVDWAIKARTLDGIDLYSMLTAQYHVEPTCAGSLYPLIRNDEGVKEQVVKARLRSVVPQVLSTYGAIEQYQGNIAPISDRIEEQLRSELEAQCVELDYFELKRGDFDDRYEDFIRQRAQQIEATEKKKLEQQTAQAEAERARIEAEGAAQRLAVETEAANKKRKADADTAAYEKTTAANAAAKAETAVLEARAAALSESPELLEWERINAINNAGAIYLPENALPIYDIPQAQPQE